jgi:hypothetical protein
MSRYCRRSEITIAFNDFLVERDGFEPSVWISTPRGHHPPRPLSYIPAKGLVKRRRQGGGVEISEPVAAGQIAFHRNRPPLTLGREHEASDVPLGGVERRPVLAFRMEDVADVAQMGFQFPRSTTQPPCLSRWPARSSSCRRCVTAMMAPGALPLNRLARRL